ncbi:MAG: hypothetical protein HY815_00495 [Candidatus Riflebacteria bacterium]|nr:hypothetical protein [Candidatus Riflebacteria bacterium]
MYHQCNGQFQMFFGTFVSGLTRDSRWVSISPRVLALLGADCMLIDWVEPNPAMEASLSRLKLVPGLSCLAAGAVRSSGRRHPLVYRYTILGVSKPPMAFVPQLAVGVRGARGEVENAFEVLLLSGLIDPLDVGIFVLGKDDSIAPTALDDTLSQPSALEGRLRLRPPADELTRRRLDRMLETVLYDCKPLAPETFEIRLSSPARRWLPVCVSRQYYAQFHATTDRGQTVPVKPIQAGMTGLLVPPGTRQVTVRHRVTPFQKGLDTLSQLSWILALGSLAFFSWPMSRRFSGSAP